MPEAEDVIIDAARHVVVRLGQWSGRRRPKQGDGPVSLLELAPRLDLLLAALQGRPWTLRVAQAPAPPSWLQRWFRRVSRPAAGIAVPSTDGQAIWLPRELPGVEATVARELYRAMALQQAARASLRGTAPLHLLQGAAVRRLYLLAEGRAADALLLSELPGLRGPLSRLRAEALRRRPPPERLALEQRPLECLLREWLAADPARHDGTRTGHQVVAQALEMQLSVAAHALEPGALSQVDWWTGDWPPADARASPAGLADALPATVPSRIRSARLSRRPEVRDAREDEDDGRPGAWMVQTSQPHEHAEDPMGLQRPADRDADQAAEAHADSVSELPQARLVRSASPSHEVLLSDDPPASQAGTPAPAADRAGQGIVYPEWDWRQGAYRHPGATVWESLAAPAPAEPARRLQREQRLLMLDVRRRFEMLRPQRTTMRRQEEGDEPDLEAVIEARADLRAGGMPSQRLYRSSRPARRSTAVLVLVDVSGSTDAWVAGQRRVVDVEREALLLLSVALDATGDPHAVLAFSGEGPQQVAVRIVKRFGERHGDEVARRIAGLEPERYTRAGAALRHASRLLEGQAARHRLLLLVSDGKPNDCDGYEGRYGIEDMRQAVLEAREAGQSVFCLTVDRHAAAYLPRIFGPHHYALLQHPARLPAVLLQWMRHLLAS